MRLLKKVPQAELWPDVAAAVLGRTPGHDLKVAVLSSPVGRVAKIAGACDSVCICVSGKRWGNARGICVCSPSSKRLFPRFRRAPVLRVSELATSLAEARLSQLSPYRSPMIWPGTAFRGRYCCVVSGRAELLQRRCGCGGPGSRPRYGRLNFKTPV